jgi:HSP20 family protein
MRRGPERCTGTDGEPRATRDAGIVEDVMAKKDKSVEVQQSPAPQPAPTAGEEAWSPLSGLRQEIERLFDDFDVTPWSRAGRRSPLRALRGNWPLAPAAEMAEDETGYTLTLEVPGCTAKDVEVKVSDGMIAIRGEKNVEREEDKKDIHVSERRYGAFHRSFSLPRGVDPEKIAARLTDGVLEVTLPKSAEAKRNERKIEVKPG